MGHHHMVKYRIAAIILLSILFITEVKMTYREKLGWFLIEHGKTNYKKTNVCKHCILAGLWADDVFTAGIWLI